MSSRTASKLRLSRRAALKVGAATAGLLAAPAIIRRSLAQPSPVRRAAHELAPDDPLVVALRQAVQTLRQRDAVSPAISFHPAGWQQMARYHGQICGPNITTVGALDPNNEVHQGWWFLPWHRAYLATVELVLREASGDPQLALPYWDWYRHPEIPEIYSGDPAENPLAHADRQPGVLVDSPLPVVGTAPDGSPIRQQEWQVVQDEAFAAFAGAKPTETPTGFRFMAGTLERGPHNRGHVFVGGHMLDFAVTGLDPLFYAHHANVDRLWEVWKNAADPDNPRTPPEDMVWVDRRFAFQNASGGALLVSSADSVATESLSFTEFGLGGEGQREAGYTYDRLELDPSERELLVASRPEAPGGVAGPASGAGRTVTLTSEGERRISERPLRLVPEAAPQGLAGPAASPRARYFVELTGVTMPKGIVRVVLKGVAGDEAPVVLGEEVFIPFLAPEEAEQATLDLRFDITEALKSRSFNPDELDYSLELAGAAQAQPLSFENARISIR